MSATTQHAAIEALVTLWDAALDSPVHDGPTVQGDKQYLGLWVGYDPLNEDDQAVIGAQENLYVGGRQREERGSIKCCAAAWSGDTTTEGRRIQIADLLTQIETAWRADITLGGAVLDSSFGSSITLHQRLTTNGNEVFAVFTIDFRSRI